MDAWAQRADAVLAEYDVLYSTVDPDSAPYRSKYAGRELLVSVVDAARARRYAAIAHC
jgi:hypothetical protein